MYGPACLEVYAHYVFMCDESISFCSRQIKLKALPGVLWMRINCSSSDVERWQSFVQYGTDSTPSRIQLACTESLYSIPLLIWAKIPLRHQLKHPWLEERPSSQHPGFRIGVFWVRIQRILVTCSFCTLELVLAPFRDIVLVGYWI